MSDEFAVTHVNASYSRRVQLERYEPVEHAVELEASLGGDADPEEVYDELHDRAEEMVEQAIAARVTQKKLADSPDEEDE